MKYAALLVGLALGGCSLMNNDENGIQACEIIVKEKLRSPSTYKRIKAEVSPYTKGGNTWRTVSLEYDADNAYGTPVRGREECGFSTGGGKFGEPESLALSYKRDKETREIEPRGR